MLKQLSVRDLASLVLRLGLGIIFLAHGYEKLTQDWGTAWAPYLDTPTQLLVAWTEFLGALFLLAGFFARVAAGATGCVMFVAMCLVTYNRGFMATESGANAPAFAFLKVGSEYNFALIMQCVAVILLGSGVFSVDFCLRHWRPRGRAVTGVATPAGVSPPHGDAVPAPAQSAQG